MNTLYIPRTLTQQLLHQAQISPNQEICGLVGGHNDTAAHVYPIDNIAESRATRFELDPKQQIAAMNTMREKGEQMLAIYHSHPTTSAEPSQYDIQLANYPDAVYLIISLNTKGVLEMRGFHIKSQQVKEIDLIMTP